MLQEFQLNAAFNLQHPDATEPVTYARDSKCLDYILLSNNLTGDEEAPDCEPFRQAIPSDRRGPFCDIIIERFLQDQSEFTLAEAEGILSSKDVQRMRKYSTSMDETIDRHNICNRLLTLSFSDTMTTAQLKTDPDAIDHTITQAALETGRRCMIKRSPWSPHLHKAHEQRFLYQLG